MARWRTTSSRSRSPLCSRPQRQLAQRTDRVKGVDLHPTEPWCGDARRQHRARHPLLPIILLSPPPHFGSEASAVLSHAAEARLASRGRSRGTGDPRGPATQSLRAARPDRTPARSRRLLANLYNGNLYLWNHSDQVSRSCVAAAPAR
jgi:hypothetical protein